MKRLFTSVLSFLMAFSLWAEAPQTISYQAVVRNNQGRLLRETNVGVRITILQEHENGHSVYTETRTVKTNVNGLMTFAIGDANGITSDTLANIAWADNSYFLRCDIDLDGGENYTLSSTSQMNSVPYALYAKNIAPEALPTWAQSEDKPVYNYSEIQDAPEVPTKVSDLENDANYITLEDVKQVVAPTKMSQMENDADYAKKSDIPSLEGYVSTEYASIAFQPKGNYITESEVSSTYQPKGNYLTKHQSLADYAKKSDLPKKDSLLSKAEASTTYQPKGNYLTEHQSLAGYVTKAEVSTTYQPKGNYLTEHQSLAGYVTKAEASETYQPKGNYLTEHQSLADYAKKTEIPAVPTKVSSFTNDAGYLTEHQSLADYAKKSELPKADSLLSKAEASTTYQPKGNYLTEHQSLADYAKKTDLPSVPTKVSELTNDAGYLTEHQSLADYAKKSDLPKKDSLLSKTEASTTYQPKGNYLTEHQSLAGYVTKAEASTTYQPKGNYLTEHQSLAGYVTKAEASTTYQPKGNYLTEHQSLADYAKKSDIPTVPTKVSDLTNDAGYITAADIPTVQVPSLTDYAKKSDLPKKDSLLSKAEASTTYQPKGNYLTEHQSLAGYVTKAEASTTYQPKGNYLTEHQSLAAYAKKSEIPSVPTKVSSFTNDAGYLTEHQSLVDYAKKSELPSTEGLLSETKAAETYQPKGEYLTEHQSLADYAKKCDIPTVPTKVSSFTNDAGYLTEHQSLADYAKKSELPKADSLLSKAEASTTYQPKGNYLTEHQSLADYAKKSEIPSVPTKVSSFTNDAGYLTEHQSLAGYVTKAEASTTYQPKGNYLTEHQSLAGYVTKAEASTTYQPKGNYLTEHQSLADYAKKSEIPSVPTKVSSFTNDAGYLTEHQSLADYAKKSDLPKKDSLLSKAEASTTYQPKGNYLTEHQSLADYAKNSDLPKKDSLLSKVEASTTYQPKGNYLTEHQSLAGYVTKAEASTTYQPKGNYLTEHQSLADYAKKSELPSVPTNVSSFTNDAGYLTEHQSLADYAKKSDLPKKDSLLSKAEASTTYQPKGNYLTEHQSLADYAKKSEIPTVPTNVSSFTNDAGYLTEHQSLAAYAKKTDIPTVPTKVSAFENDATYIKKADFDAIIADYSALLNKYKTELDSLKNVMSNAASGGVIRTVAIDNGALPGEFSVSATKKVKFSMGNLQYQASTKTWRFAANQYDYVGTPNTNISANYDGWIDLFGWGTSGWNSGATSYLPYSTNTVDGAYCPSKSLSINLVDNYSNADWGYYNAISNGGNEKGLWRTLTKDEWTYLFSGRPNAEQLKKSVTIDGVKGYVFFPDNWVEPEGISISSMSEFSIAKWNILESLGAVFLPAAGKRNETTISFVNTSAVYWSSTSGYGFDIEKSSISSFSRYYGYSVRLVKLQPQTISVNIEPSEGGYVDGVGSYEKGSVINLTAIPESGYFFKEWSDGVKSPNRKVTLNSNITLSAIYVKTEGIKEKGIIPGHFSVSANKTVYFSRGNLQYQASTDTWRFAEHQYDRIGADNKNISETYDGWIDLFGWGTSGFYDANISFPNKNHYPYSSSTKTYSNSFNYYEYGPPTSKVDKNLTGTSANYDWGVYNAISNGGNQKGQWRVLTADEWTYLYSGRKNAANLRTRATVEGVEGYIFLPDNWVNPDGISLSLNQNLFTINSYTSSEWNILEAYNAVFLPAAGSRSGTTVNNVGTKGYYWSSTYYEFRYSNYFNFDGLQRIERYCGLSVRLVQEVK